MTEMPIRSRDRSRRHDIVLWGATGFTGALVAEYLVERYSDSDVRLALAGRSREKLEAVRRDLARIDPRAAELPILVADSHDRASLDALAADAEVICTTVGPYARYGEPLVAACVAHGTDYCDLTGEVPFIRRMIDGYHEEAGRTGARIVHCCGFDSIPSDIGTWMMQEAARERFGAPLREVHCYAGESKGSASGGTIASMAGIVEEAKREAGVRRLLLDPYGLDPAGGRRGPPSPDPRGVHFDRRLPSWTAPFVMSAINTRIVRRSNALLGYPYGTDFAYREVMSTGTGPKGLARATAVAAGMGALMGALAIDPLRELLLGRVLPKPGEGPSREAREAGYFVMRFVGETADGRVLRGRVEGHKDPGYGETAKMLGESALCLAVEGGSAGGVRTPASTMGTVLLERLRRAGMVFEVTA